MEAHKEFVNGDCDVCHKSGPKGDVALNLSSGGAGLDPISCIGCHGRAQDRIGDPSNPTLCADPENVVGPCGDGAGLREHHALHDVTECVTCHQNDLVPVGEDFLPTYYAQQGTDPDYAIPTDPCNPAPDFPELLRSPVAGLDNDGDGAYDEGDLDCITPQCGDGIDNDGDGLTDFAGGDPGCDSADDLLETSPDLVCDNGLDDDGDGFVDHPDDPGCGRPGAARENPQCQDGIDNDGQVGIDFDGGASLNGGVPIDVADPNCLSFADNREAVQSGGGCGMGPELALLLPGLWWVRRRWVCAAA
jgi:hypothetical protein